MRDYTLYRDTKSLFVQVPFRKGLVETAIDQRLERAGDEWEHDYLLKARKAVQFVEYAPPKEDE